MKRKGKFRRTRPNHDGVFAINFRTFPVALTPMPVNIRAASLSGMMDLRRKLAAA